MALGTLSIDLIAKVAELQAGFDKATRLAEQSASKMGAAFQIASTAAIGIGSALAGALAGGAILGQIKARIDGLSDLKSAFDATGSSIENLSGLEDVAARTGTSFETVTSALVKLNQALNTAQPGSDQAKAIEAIGLSVAELKKEDPAEAFRKIAVALAKFADDGSKGRVELLLFGKSLKEVAPLLQNLTETGELVATVTTKQALAAEAFTNHLADLEKNAIDLGRSIANELLPPMNRLLDAFKTGGFGGVAKALDNGALGKALGFDDLNQAVLKAKRLEGVISAIEESLANPKIGAAASLSFGRALLARTEELKKAQEAIAVLNGTAKTPLPDAPARPSIDDPTGKSKTDDSAAKKAEAYIESLRKQLEGTQDLTTAERVLEEIRVGSLKGGTQKAQNTAKALGLEIDATKEAIRVARERSDLRNKDEQAANDAARENERAGREEVRALLADTSAAKYARAQKDIEKLNRTFIDAVGNFRDGFDPGQYAEAVGQVTEKIGDKTIQKMDELTVFADQASRNIQDALGNTLEQVLGGNFDNIGKLWLGLLNKMVAQALATKLNESLFGKDGQGGSATDLLKSLGGLFLGSFGGGKAIGGPVDAGTTYLVGERGPELIVPRDNARVLTAGDTRSALAGGGGRVVINNNQVTNIDARSDQAQIAQLVAASNARSQESMWRQLKARGIA